MPNHIPSEMTLTFETNSDLVLFEAHITSNENICQNVQPVVWDGDFATITFRDGTKETASLKDTLLLPAAQDHWWGTKWGTYDLDIVDQTSTTMIIRFNTAWGTMSDSMLLAIIDKYDIEEMDYIALDEGMCWAASLTLELGEISTFILDSDDCATVRDWRIAVNDRWGYEVIDIDWHDEMEAEEL